MPPPLVFEKLNHTVWVEDPESLWKSLCQIAEMLIKQNIEPFFHNIEFPLERQWAEIPKKIEDVLMKN